MPTPSVKRRRTRAASKTQFGEAELGGFLRKRRKPLSVFIALEQRLYPPADHRRRSTFILDMATRFCKNISVAEISTNSAPTMDH